ncbi:MULTISPECIES: alpha/beta fold hydrolase [unclassified Spirosoma]|uniref:YheT family hydrolase n=1 Tax=unclassified Spirosoma TaxID=2621999 RepID=UPI000959779A|nr:MULTISPECIES: alpha/beta fold hydrolase [unclassified Spirosoma]MBN8822953.1 alpha/beta fold hydrolase [Spirosoma sp.]OJW80136.1 MAG: alpha/beta hydrolase [Spirosoma sp. 48-14]
MPLIRSSYPGPPTYQYNGHLQTIIPSLTRVVTGVTYERERLTLSDGDFVDLDWIDKGQKQLLVLTHGLEGDSNRQYIRGTAKLFSEHGYDVLAWNCRSCSGEMNQAFRLYNHGEIGDLGEVIQRALQRKAYHKIVLVGYSMGGNITLKYLGVYGKQLPEPVKGGIAISAPTDLGASAVLLDRAANWFYRKRFMKKLIVKISEKDARYPGRLDMSKLQQVKQWRDFDEFFSAPVNSYRDADDFYTQASAVNFMPGIAVPALLLNAQNDPLLSPECSPAWLAETHKQIFLETPQKGGHVGFQVVRDEYTYAERTALSFAQNIC